MQGFPNTTTAPGLEGQPGHSPLQPDLPAPDAAKASGGFSSPLPSPPRSPGRTRSRDISQRVRMFISQGRQSEAGAAAVPFGPNGVGSPQEVGADMPSFMSPFAGAGSPKRPSSGTGSPKRLSSGTGSWHANRDATSRLTSMSESLASEPSLPWADPVLLEEVRHNSMRASRAGSEAEPLIDHDGSAPRPAHASRPSSRAASRMGSGIPHAPFPANSIKTTERVNSGAVPPPSPFFAGEDDISADQLDFDDYGMSSASSEGGSGVSLEHQFSGLSSLSQSELAMVMQLTEEIKAEPEAISNALNNLNLEELSQLPPATAGRSNSARQAVLEQTMSRLRAVLPPEVAQHLPPPDAEPLVGQQAVLQLGQAAAAQAEPPPPFAEPLPDSDLDAAAGHLP